MNGGRRLRIEPSSMERAGHGLAQVTIRLDEAVTKLRADLAAQGALVNFRARRAAAYKAYWEHMPLRGSSIPVNENVQLYRRFSWGRLATFHMLDTRQYRSDQVCVDQPGLCRAADDPARSITGAAQEAWLLDGMAASPAA